MEKRDFKIVLLGDGNVGKTTLMYKHLANGAFLDRYVATLGVEVHPLLFLTNYGPIKFNVWDCAGVEKFGGLRDGYYIGADGGVLMFDVTNLASHTHLNRWARDLWRTQGRIPMAICGNKCDLVGDRVVFGRDVDIPSQVEVKEYGDPYFDVSVATSHNIEKPFLFLARALTGCQDLEFIGV